MSYKVLVVDDEPDIRQVLELNLTANNYEVATASSGDEALEFLKLHPNMDLILMDIMMPGKNGIQVCRELRGYCTSPVLFLTAKTQEKDKQSAYDVGGDDYLAKPFSQSELLMKVSSLIRRYRKYNKGESDNYLPADNLQMNRGLHCIMKEDVMISLTDKEYDIMQYFMNHRGQPLDPRTIYEDVWEEEFLPSANNTVMVHVLNLRRKLEEDVSKPKIIRTIWGKGYQVD